MKGLLATLLIKLGLDSKEFNSGINSAEKKGNKFGDAMKKIGGVIAGAFAIQKIISFGKELINLSGVAEGVRSAFNRIADSRTLSNLQDATKGTVSQLDLMKRAVSAQNLGVPIENLASLFEFATKRAQDTGESVDYLVNSIVVGIGRKSPLILDNLGISAIQLREKLDGVSLAAASTADIAAAVGKIAAESMSASGDIIDTNAIKVQNLTAKWEDFKLSVAESPGFKKFISSELDDVSNSMEVLFSENLSFWDKFIGWTSIGGKNMENLARKSKRLKDEMAELAEIADNMGPFPFDTSSQGKVDLEWHVKTIQDLIDETTALKDEVNTYGITQEKEIQATLRQIEANEELIKSLTSIKHARSSQTFAPMTTRGDANVGSYDLITNVNQGLEIDKLVKANAERAKKAYEEYLRDWNTFKDQMKMAAVDFSVDVVDELGMAFGQLAATGKFPADFGQNILSIIGGFISQLGQMLIGLGVASEAFQSLLKSAFTNPVSAGLAIAAGAALVFLGGAIKGAAKAGPSGGGTSSVSSPSYSSAGGLSSGSGSRNDTWTFELDGTKLRAVLNNVERKNILIR